MNKVKNVTLRKIETRIENNERRKLSKIFEKFFNKKK